MKTVLEIRNKDIVGMVSEYSQKIGICENCHLIVTQNPFSQELLTNRYKNMSKFEYDNVNYILDANDEYKRRMKRIKNFIYETLSDDSIESIFEVGASTGYNLSLYDSIEKYGVEPSKINVNNAKKLYDVNLFCGDFDEYWKSELSQKKKYQLIFLAMTLEHIVDPDTFIKKLSEINSKYMFIEVPTFDFKFVDEPFGMFCEEHVNMFSFESLQYLMNKHGYQLVDANIQIQKRISLPAAWPAMDSIWEKRDSITRFQIVNSVEHILYNYINESRLKLKEFDKILNKVSDDSAMAVWGTGHHASMLYYNTCLNKKNIIKVYDSDERKKGMEMFGCRIETFNELDILEGKIDAILVATYTAREQLLKVLEKYKTKLKIIDLYGS